MALLLAIGILASVEGILRILGAECLVAYEQGGSARFTIRHHVQALGVAEICIVGSSRTNNGISCPTVTEELRAELGREYLVANYASGGAQIPEIVPLVRFLLRNGHPKVLLFGVEPDQLEAKDFVNERAAIFWNTQDFRRARKRFGSQVDQYYPQVCRNELEGLFFTLRLRGRPGNLLRTLANGSAVVHPVRGDVLIPAHTEQARLSLKVNDAVEAQVRRHVETDHLVDGRFPFSEERLKSLAELIQLCDARSVPLVFFEVPDAQVYSKNFPSDTHSRFSAVFQQLAQESSHVHFVSIADLGLNFTDDEFRDPVHLNLDGARKLSTALTRRITAIVFQHKDVLQ